MEFKFMFSSIQLLNPRMQVIWHFHELDVIVSDEFIDVNLHTFEANIVWYARCK